MKRNTRIHLAVIACAAAIHTLAPTTASALDAMTKPPAETRTDQAPATSIHDFVGYDGGFFLKDRTGDFSLKLNAQGQVLWALTAAQEEDGREIETALSVPLARLNFKGNVFSKQITFGFQTDFGNGNASLKDYYVDFAFIPKVLQLRVGQWIRPFSRQQITPSSKFEFTGRAITDKKFNAGRDIGIALHNDYAKSPVFEWVIGVFNGTGEKPWFEGEVELDDAGQPDGVTGKFTNVPDVFDPALVARVGFNTNKLNGYSEADLEGGAPRFGMGLNGVVDLDADNSNDGHVRGTIDYMFKAYGFSSTGAFYAATAQDGLYWKNQGFGALGLHVQAGYVIAQKVQPVFRYALYNASGADNALHEILGGISCYFRGHNLKWQTEAGGLLQQDGPAAQSDIVVRSQLQLAF